MHLLQKIKALNPQAFEQLIYDLTLLKGMKNVRWRTPGRDAGRDIEGEFVATDFSGEGRTEKWYVECKRHAKALDWPTVFEKLAYATSNDADYLLVCTTSALSPQCRDEIAKHESRSGRPRIRAWIGADIEREVASQPILVSKYGLVESNVERELAALPLLKIVTKTINQIAGEAALNETTSPSIEFAAAAAELARAWLESTEIGLPSHGMVPKRDMYKWTETADLDSLSTWNSFALRSLFSGLRFVSRAPKLQLNAGGDGIRSNLTIGPLMPLTKVMRDVLDTVCVMADWEWSTDGKTIVVTQR